MDILGKVLMFAGRLILFILLTIIFIPSFLVVTYLQETWNKLLDEIVKF